MASQTEVERSSAARTGLRTVGLLGLAAGLIGVAVWGVIAAFVSDYGSVAEGTLASEVVEIGVEDPVGDPDLWTARDERGDIVWQGSRADWDAVEAEGRSAYQSDLRRTWLYPALGIAMAGLVVVASDRLRKSRPAATKE